MKKLADRVSTWSVWKQGSFRGVAFNGDYLEQGNERLLVDPPPLNSWEFEHLSALGPPTRVLITNAHHLRAAVEACERFGATLHLPAADAGAMACAGARVLEDGDDLFGLRVFGLRDQKTPGESAFHCAEARFLIVGDALIGSPAGSLCMLPDAKFLDVAAARKALAPLGELDLELLLTGDGEPILMGAIAALRRFLDGGAAEAALAPKGRGLEPDRPG